MQDFFLGIMLCLKHVWFVIIVVDVLFDKVIDIIHISLDYVNLYPLKSIFTNLIYLLHIIIQKIRLILIRH